MLPPKKNTTTKKPVSKKPVPKPAPKPAPKPTHLVGTLTRVLTDSRTGKVISRSTVTPEKSSIKEAFKNGGSVKRKKKK